MDIATKTARDAAARVRLARTGSLGNAPSIGYLEALRSELSNWLQAVDSKLEQQEEERFFGEPFDPTCGGPPR